MGVPTKYRGVSERGIISTQDVGVKGPSELYDDIYEFQTSLNEYRLTVSYFEDDSESQFHPVSRVFGLTFELDKRVPVSAYASLLDDLPLVAAFCGTECTVAERKWDDDLGGLYLRPKNPKAQEVADAQKVTTMRGKPTLWLVVERGAITKALLMVDDVFDEATVRATWAPKRARN